MKDLDLNHWLMLNSKNNTTKEISLGFVYLVAIFSIAYVCVSFFN